MSATDLAELVLTGGLLTGIGDTCARPLVSGGQRGRLRLVALRRAPRARRAAAEAALDDPTFARERIEAAVSDVRVRVRATIDPNAHAQRVDLAWTLELDEATHGHPRWRLVDRSAVS